MCKLSNRTGWKVKKLLTRNDLLLIYASKRHIEKAIYEHLLQYPTNPIIRINPFLLLIISYLKSAILSLITSRKKAGKQSNIIE